MKKVAPIVKQAINEKFNSALAYRSRLNESMDDDDEEGYPYVNSEEEIKKYFDIRRVRKQKSVGSGYYDDGEYNPSECHGYTRGMETIWVPKFDSFCDGYKIAYFAFDEGVEMHWYANDGSDNVFQCVDFWDDDYEEVGISNNYYSNDIELANLLLYKFY